MTTDNHVCHVDCELIVGRNGATQHIMYPAEPNRDAGRYQASQNLNMTRREYRASGQDESRNVRMWNLKRRYRPKMYSLRRYFRLTGIVVTE